jgi:hypothetical protein
MKYHAIYLNDACVIRPANHGVSDIEWMVGCRTYHTPFQSKYQLEQEIQYQFKIHDERQWSQLIGSLYEPSQRDNYISTRVVRDKWDSDRPIY